MMKSLLTSEKDLKEAAVIEKRRIAEEERKRRFFDAKQRILGIDCNELDRQVAEKEQMLQANRERARLEAEEMQRNLEVAEARENEMREQKRQSEIEINEYRKLCQQPKDCNDFDLNDPNGNKKTLPARVDDNDPRLSKSGGQLFIGEDLTHQDRIREQKVLQKQWLDQQIAERKNLAINKKKSDNLMHEMISQHDMYSVSQCQRMMGEKRDIQRQIREYNEALAQQKRDNDKKRRAMDQQDDLAEIYNLMSSDLLKEHMPKGSNLGPNRIIPYAYKQMTEEQIELFKKEQEIQKNDIGRRKLEDQQQKEEWNRLADATHREMSLKERVLSRNIRSMNFQLREENEKLAKEQKHKIEHYEKVVNTNPPTEEYFDQFNTSSR